MPPSTAFAQPDESLAVLHPAHGVLVLQPGRIGLLEDRLNRSSLHIPKHDAVDVLEAIHLLDQNRCAVGSPLHLREIMFAWITRHIEPADLTTGGADHADFAGRIRLADLGIGERSETRVGSMRVVEEMKVLDPGGVESPESN